MPLPKRSKLISKRFKKPMSTINPATTTHRSPASSSCSSSSSSSKKMQWPPSPAQWRIRVICTDPDATDDSSADEADDPDPSSPSPSARKRLIREICLPFPSCPSPSPSSQRRRNRHIRSSCRDFSTPQPEPTSSFEAATGTCPSSLCPPSPSIECRVTEEEFRRFLSEFLPEQDDGCVWDCELDRSDTQEGNLSEVLDLELDSEALSWINSMQRLP